MFTIATQKQKQQSALEQLVQVSDDETREQFQSLLYHPSAIPKLSPAARQHFQVFLAYEITNTSSAIGHLEDQLEDLESYTDLVSPSCPKQAKVLQVRRRILLWTMKHLDQGLARMMTALTITRSSCPQ